MKEPVQLVVVGSIGLDTIETPEARQEEILGGSVSYACAGPTTTLSTLLNNTVA